MGDERLGWLNSEQVKALKYDAVMVDYRGIKDVMTGYTERHFWECLGELFNEIGAKPPESGERLARCTDSVMLAIAKVKELKKYQQPVVKDINDLIKETTNEMTRRINEDVYGELQRSKIPEAQQYKTGAVMYGNKSKEIKNQDSNYYIDSYVTAGKAINDISKKVGFLTRNFDKWNEILEGIEAKAETRIKAAEEKVYIAEKKLETQASSLDALKDRVDSFELRY